MTFTHPDEWPILPKDYRIITTRQGDERVAAIMPYPSTENVPCEGDEAYITEEIRDKDTLDYMRSKCGRCPSQLACLEWGTAHESWGIWGGASKGERAEIRKERGQIMFDPMSAHEYGMGRDALQIYNYGVTAEDEWSVA